MTVQKGVNARASGGASLPRPYIKIRSSSMISDLLAAIKYK